MEKRESGASRRKRANAARSGLHLVVRAANFAAHKHRDQRRKGVERRPYINHPLELAEILCTEGDISDSNVIAAAILHDTVEDTETSLDELRGHFGGEIAAIVSEVTDSKFLDKATRKRLQIAKAGHISRGAALVKLADKISNLRSVLAAPPAGWSLRRKQQYFDWAKLVVDRIRHVHPGLARRFDAVYRRRLK